MENNAVETLDAQSTAVKMPEDITLGQLSEKDQQAVRDYAEKIDVSNASEVLQYGSAAQQKLTVFADTALANARTKDTGVVGDTLAGLVAQLQGFAPAEEKKGFLGLFKRTGNQLATMKALLFEIIPKRKISEHLKKGPVTCSVADAIQVRRADALLAGRHTMARRLFLAGEPRLHRRHAGVDEQDGLVVLRNERKARQTQMTLRLKELQIHLTKLVETICFVCHNKISFYRKSFQQHYARQGKAK